MKFTLIEKKQVFPDVTTFVFKPKEKINFVPGQFMHYFLPHPDADDRGTDRYFTIAAPTYEGVIKITTRFAGDEGSSFKRALFEMVVGETIEAEGPEGEFTLDHDPEREYVFIAGGIGITPFRSIILDMDHFGKPMNLTLLYANHDKNIVFKDELEAVTKRNPNFKIVYIMSPEHIDENNIKKYVPDLSKPVFYVSGPEPMVDATVDVLKKLNIESNKIKKDFFPGYKKI